MRLRTLLRNPIHAILADYGHDRPSGCWSGPGRAWLASLQLPAVSGEVVNDDLALIDALQDRIDRLDWEIHQRARSGPRVKVLTQLPGVGPFTALVILVEIGDVSRFGSARKLASWAGLTPPSAAPTASPTTGTSPSRARRGCCGFLCEAAQTARRHPQFVPPGLQRRDLLGVKLRA